MINITKFKTESFITALKDFFTELNIPVNYLADEPANAAAILDDKYKPDNEAHKLIDEVYALGIVNNDAFNGKGLFEDEETLKDIKSVKNNIKKDYDGLLLFGVTLKSRPGDLLPTRGHLAEITRSFNRAFPYTPVTIIFKYDAYITFANSERCKYKQEWREGEKAGKVTMLKDISFEKPHAAHERILLELKINYEINTFDALYKHWQKVLDTKELNKQFFQELANWYFWAMDIAQFPDDIEQDREKRNATNLIRLITRIIFIWFIKEKKLVPVDIFKFDFLKRTIKDFSKDNNSANYYTAILQNLFFGTLNQKMNERDFAEDHLRKNKLDQGVKNLYRYADKFNIPKEDIKILFKDIPFLNGGLFDCLDKFDEEKLEQGKKEQVFIDGFTRNESKQAIIPDYLFFGNETEIDLKKYFDPEAKKPIIKKVHGLLNMLDRYKFTIEENTPIEEEIALDPELLGRVFENLLAYYNPETQNTARKQTGSFYTPREIVNNMVDESLIEYLKQKCEEFPDIENRLRILFSYSENFNPFNENETKKLIQAINKCKMLDPACGSGAFPMGMLQKMVYILTKLDPDNSKWKAEQEEKIIGEKIKELEKDKKAIEGLSDIALKEKAIEAVDERLKEIKDIFESENNFDDYARKLFLIENCIYGVDIQPIAVQITKLRFFISLIVDQNKQDNKENFGIRSLPNLETKFVAANTLIGLDKPKQTILRNPQIEDKENELKKLRHNYFNARTRKEKLFYQLQDKLLRKEIAKMLEDDGWDTNVAKKIVAFDPYNQNISAPFFEIEWMFGLLEGFDIVIANPPYLKERDNAHIFNSVKLSPLGKSYHQGKMDFWYYFLHLAINISSRKSVISFITSRYWINSHGAEKLIDRVKTNLSFISVVDIGKLKVFDNVAGHHMIHTYSKNKRDIFKYKKIANDIKDIDSETNNENITIQTLKNKDVFNESEIIFASQDIKVLTTSILGDKYFLGQGVVEATDKVSSKQLKKVGRDDINIGDGVFVLTKTEIESLNLNDDEKKIIGKYIDPNDVKAYIIEPKQVKFIIYSDKNNRIEIEKNPKYVNIKSHLDFYCDFITSSNKPYGLHRPREIDLFKRKKILFKGMFDKNEFAIDKEGFFGGMSFISIIENKSQNGFSLEFLLGILNSKFALNWFFTYGKKRGTGVDIGVDKLRTFPIPINSNKEIEILVNDVISKKTKGSDTTELEQKIDNMVYKLYQLTYEEVLVIDKDLSNQMSKEEYNALDFAFEYTKTETPELAKGTTKTPLIVKDKKQRSTKKSDEDLRKLFEMFEEEEV